MALYEDFGQTENVFTDVSVNTPLLVIPLVPNFVTISIDHVGYSQTM